MKIIKQSWSFVREPDGVNILRIIEEDGRTCYKSEMEYDDWDSVKKFVKKMIESGHHSVIEHGAVSVRIITDRGVTHELVRHRLAAYSQESTRYCNYSKDKFGNEITVILPIWFYDVVADRVKVGKLNNTATKRELQYAKWESGCSFTEQMYFDLINYGQTPQEARSVLPNSLKTEIVMTANLREWRHVFTLRCSSKAHPQIRQLMIDMLTEFRRCIPIIFDDIFDKFYIREGKKGV